MDRNIFIPCCKETGVVGIDFDSQEAAERARKKLPHTELRTVTPNGLHLLYPAPEGLDIGSAVKIEVGGILADIRWGTAILIAGQSKHPTGKHYRREGSWSLDRSWEFDPALIKRKQVGRRPKTHKVGRDRQQLLRRAIGYGRKVVCVEHKGAHNTFFRYCCWMTDVLRLTRDEIRFVLESWNQTNCFREDGATPYSWSDAEIEHKLRSVEKR